jgi:hypothetical protein
VPEFQKNLPCPHLSICIFVYCDDDGCGRRSSTRIHGATPRTQLPLRHTVKLRCYIFFVCFSCPLPTLTTTPWTCNTTMSIRRPTQSGIVDSNQLDALNFPNIFIFICLSLSTCFRHYIVCDTCRILHS